MTAVEVLSDALDDTERFLQAQKGLDCFPQVLEQQCAAVLRQCQMLPKLTGDQAAALIEKVKDKLGQLAINISPIVLAISVVMLGNPQVSNYTKLDHIAVRMVRIGLDIPNEVTAGHVLKLLGSKATLTHHVNSAS